MDSGGDSKVLPSKLVQCITLSPFIVVTTLSNFDVLAYISSYLLPHSMDSSNYFCIIFSLSHSFILSIQINFTLLSYVTVSQFRIF